MADTFTGEVGLVTGGNSGIGLATALGVANAGARLVSQGAEWSNVEQL